MIFQIQSPSFPERAGAPEPRRHHLPAPGPAPRAPAPRPARGHAKRALAANAGRDVEVGDDCARHRARRLHVRAGGRRRLRLARSSSALEQRRVAPAVQWPALAPALIVALAGGVERVDGRFAEGILGTGRVLEAAIVAVQGGELSGRGRRPGRAAGRRRRRRKGAMGGSCGGGGGDSNKGAERGDDGERRRDARCGRAAGAPPWCAPADAAAVAAAHRAASVM